jgi:hypothetical protein
VLLMASRCICLWSVLVRSILIVCWLTWIRCLLSVWLISYSMESIGTTLTGPVDVGAASATARRGATSASEDVSGR